MKLPTSVNTLVFFLLWEESLGNKDIFFSRKMVRSVLTQIKTLVILQSQNYMSKNPSSPASGKYHISHFKLMWIAPKKLREFLSPLALKN